MFRDLSEYAYIICLIFASLIFIGVLGYLIIGIIVKTRGISLKLILRGEEYVFAAISSIVIFLTFSFPIALGLWILIYFIMGILFKNDQKIIRSIEDLEQSIYEKIHDLNVDQLESLGKKIPYVYSPHIILWINDFQLSRRAALISSHTSFLKSKFKPLPFSFFSTGVVGISIALLTYGNLVDYSNSFPMLLLENYAVLSCVLAVMYVVLYISTVKNIYNYAHGNKKLFNIIFAVFSVIMCVGVAMISLNNG